MPAVNSLRLSEIFNSRAESRDLGHKFAKIPVYFPVRALVPKLVIDFLLEPEPLTVPPQIRVSPALERHNFGCVAAETRLSSANQLALTYFGISTRCGLPPSIRPLSAVVGTNCPFWSRSDSLCSRWNRECFEENRFQRAIGSPVQPACELEFSCWGRAPDRTA